MYNVLNAHRGDPELVRYTCATLVHAVIGDMGFISDDDRPDGQQLTVAVLGAGCGELVPPPVRKAAGAARSEPGPLTV